MFHPSGRPYRLLVLLFASILPFGSYYAYDTVSAIEKSLMKTLSIEQDQIGMMYTVYSIAAILFLLVGGVLIDRLGTRKASMIFSTAVILGAAIVALADNVYMIYIGRFVFGAGSETLIVAQSAIIARWFKGKELAFAFGFGLFVARFGTLFTYNTAALFESRFSLTIALWVAVAFCGVSLLSNVVYVLLDRRGERILALREPEAGERIVLDDVKRLRPSFWFVSLLCVTFYSAIFPFQALAPDFFHERWGLPTEIDEGGGIIGAVVNSFRHMFDTATGTTSIIIMASMIFAPFAGMLVDRIGRRASMMVVGSLMLIPCYLSLAFLDLAPKFPMMILGAAFVLVPAAMWPAVALIVDERRVGTAYGLMTLIQNLGLGLFPWLNGKLRVLTEGYTASMLMFASLGVVGVVFAFLLLRADRRMGGVLEKP